MVRPILNYFKDVKTELGKVEWPSASEVIKLTIMVFVITLIVGVYIGLLDLGFTKLLEYAISIK